MGHGRRHANDLVVDTGRGDCDLRDLFGDGRSEPGDMERHRCACIGRLGGCSRFDGLLVHRRPVDRRTVRLLFLGSGHATRGTECGELTLGIVRWHAP